MGCRGKSRPEGIRRRGGRGGRGAALLVEAVGEALREGGELLEGVRELGGDQPVAREDREGREEAGLGVARDGGQAVVHEAEAEVEQVLDELARRRVRQVVRHDRRDDEPVARPVAADGERLFADHHGTGVVVERQRQAEADGESLERGFGCAGGHAATSCCPGSRMKVARSILP